MQHGRKKEVVTVPAGFGRDSDPPKRYLITEWPARRGEKWANRVIAAMTRGGIKLDQSLIGRGMEAIFYAGMNSIIAGQITSQELQPILDELFECVKCVRDVMNIDQATGMPLATDFVSDDDIEEIKTVYWLRSEVLRIHTNFSVFDAVLNYYSLIMTRRDSETIQT